MISQIRFHASDLHQDVIRKDSPDYSAGLYNHFKHVIKPVDARRDDTPDGVRECYLMGVFVQSMVSVFVFNSILFNQGIDDLFYDQGVTGRSFENEFLQPWINFLAFKYGLD